MTVSRRAALQTTLASAGIFLARTTTADEVSDASLLLDPQPTGVADPDLVGFDRLMTSFMTLNEVPGGALAVTKDGLLVYARGFGFANVLAKKPVQPDSLFRIASISKPITAVAILQLVERGKLKLDDKVCDLLEIQPHLDGDMQPDPRLKDVTILHLLHHSAGWDSKKSFDPMVSRSVEIAAAVGSPPPASPHDIIRYVFGRPLDFTPGERYAYSNFGYCVLGRVIELVTGKSYETHVHDEVLAPLGITQMQLGKTLPTERATNEVTYYDDLKSKTKAVRGPHFGEPVSTPDGGWNLEAMDSHGGWIASAIDLVRFASAFDVPDKCPVLRAESIRTMFARPAGGAGQNKEGKREGTYYGCGWNVNPQGTAGRANHFHAGGLDGTATLLVHRGDGLSWAVLFNACQTPQGTHLGQAIDPYLHRAAAKVRQWPVGDRFGS